MKTIFASLALGFCLTVPVHASELRLEGGGPPAAAMAAKPAEATGSGVPARVHLGLDRGEQNATLVCELPAVPVTYVSAPASTLPAATGARSVATPPEWAGSSAVQTPALLPGALSPARPMATLAPVLPLGSASDSGVADSWVYAGLGAMLMGLGWVGRTQLRQRHVSAAWSPGGESGRARRAVRVKMMPLKC